MTCYCNLAHNIHFYCLHPARWNAVGVSNSLRYWDIIVSQCSSPKTSSTSPGRTSPPINLLISAFTSPIVCVILSERKYRIAVFICSIFICFSFTNHTDWAKRTGGRLLSFNNLISLLKVINTYFQAKGLFADAIGKCAYSVIVTFGRLYSRSTKLKQAWICTRLIAMLNC